ncbi:MAG: alpha-galactosidase [Chthonomonadales bacterium]|nr:alpha-galactosidase [Chthonomonadales bacterium]
MPTVKFALIGAGSRSFGPSSVRDILLSDLLAEAGIHLVLVDKLADRLDEALGYAQRVAERLSRRCAIEATTNLDRALDGASFVVKAIEVDRFLYWTQDFHIPRHYGFRQVFGENGGPGSLFHALRNMGPTVEIARAMERCCPDALLLSFTNPEHKLCEAVSRCTSITAFGLCHGVFMGLHQIAGILGVPVETLDAKACGINHFTWFQSIRDRQSGEDLYPRLRAAEAEGDWLSDWHEIGLARILFRRYGLWPSPAANHYGEYIGWADEFVASELQYFYDPEDGHPWETGRIPEFVYSLSGDKTTRPWRKPDPQASSPDDAPLRPSGELAVPIMEAVACGIRRDLDAVNMPNRGAIPNLPDDMVVEVPAVADGDGVRAVQMEPLPEAIAAMLRTQGSINKLLVEAFSERSRAKLLQAILLEPTVNSYRNAVAMMNEMLRLQASILPPMSPLGPVGSTAGASADRR